MKNLFIYKRLLLVRDVRWYSRNNVSKYIHKEKSAKAIRQIFLDYFINDCNHNFVRSSPVVPFCDPSVAFVNAGMNQFKGILLGTQTPQYTRVANTQKCIRVGGKHNDINVVGSDGYHHTFFEMLGNWSFGNYFKKDACEMAWNLLTQKYKIPKQILYVTYFGGDKSLKLEPDLECKDIWKSIGVSDDRILPFGMKDNFWEMGPTGPCGPCTEIHVDLLGICNRANFINKDLPDLTELWNIVFIQYNRCPDGSIKTLSQNHVDTGMGLERLTALLQGKISNYDTDIFTNIFSGIQKICKGVPSYGGNFGEKDWNHLDTNFRILADHTRMIVVCLADGVIPEQNQKLRRIMRRAFSIGETVFKKETGLLKELSNYVVESLGCVYPELEKNIHQIHQIIDYEEEVYRYLRAISVGEWQKIIEEEPNLLKLDIIEMPGLVSAYNEIKQLPNNKITSSVGFKLYDTYGLDEETILDLSQALNLQFDVEGFRNELNNAKIRSREQSVQTTNTIFQKLIKAKLKVTDDSFKYDYVKENSYNFNPLETKLLKVIANDILLDKLEANKNCSILLDKTNLYTEAGGQIGDRGFVKFNNVQFLINSTKNINGYILHEGILKGPLKQSVSIGSSGFVEIDKDVRMNCAKNHTGVHLLNAVLQQLKGAVCQKSSKVTPNYLNLDVGIFGSKFSIEDVKKIDEEIKSLIKQKVNVTVSNVDSQTLTGMNNVTVIPGEIYPETRIRLVDITGANNFQSREPCCGTHVLNTGDLDDFCLISFKSLGRSTTSLHAVTGVRAQLAEQNGKNLLRTIAKLQEKANKEANKDALETEVSKLRQGFKYAPESSNILPAIIKHQCADLLNNINKQLKNKSKEILKEFIEMEMQTILNNNDTASKKYLVHYLQCSTMLETVSLQKATKLCQDLPIIVIAYTDNTVKARCCVPKNKKNKHFDAEKWLTNSVGRVFNSLTAKTKSQDSTLVCNMKSKKVNIKDWDTLLQQGIAAATNYADEHLK